MYDDFSRDYDRFVNWKARLAFEMPQIERFLTGAGARQVLDAASGTGMHALELARRGFSVFGADLSEGMVQTARENAAAAGLPVQFEAAGFGALRGPFGEGQFDALLCLGNSLPHVLTEEQMHRTLHDFSVIMKPGGLLLLQMRNFYPVIAEKQRFMPLQAQRDGEKDWLFMRFYDYLPDGLIQFNVVILKRQGEGDWQQKMVSSMLRPWLWEELRSSLEKAGFGNVTPLGSMTGDAFNLEKSGDLVITANRL